MSNNKLKAKTLSNISTLQGSLDGCRKGIDCWDVEDFERMKPRLIKQLEDFSNLASDIKEDIIEIMCLK